MKLRRVKRKKMPTLPPKNEEDTAQDSLFEISNFMEDWGIDESHCLAAERSSLVTEARPSVKRTPSAIRRSVMIRNCNFQEGRRAVRIHHERFTPLATRNHERVASLKASQVIYNSLVSNNVFVGQKSDEKPRLRGHNCLMLGHQKAPKGYSLPPTISVHLKAKTEPSHDVMSQSQVSMGKGDLSWKTILESSGGNRLYGKVKQTMRREHEGWLRQ